MENARGRGRGGYRGQGRGRGRQYFTKATLECYKCHNLGHFQYECPQLKGEANYAGLDSEEEPLLVMAYIEETKAIRNDAWFVDSACSNHMCGNVEMFSSIEEGYTHSVKCGNNSRMSGCKK